MPNSKPGLRAVVPSQNFLSKRKDVTLLMASLCHLPRFGLCERLSDKIRHFTPPCSRLKPTSSRQLKDTGPSAAVN
jgi:hypothetical protein